MLDWSDDLPEKMAMTQPTPQDNKSARGGTAWRFLPVIVIVAGLIFGYAMGWQQYLSIDFLAQSRESLKETVGAYPFLAPVAFAVLYALAVAFSFPAASVLTIFAGFLFGWLLGGALVAVAATVGATALYLAARSALGDFLTARIGGRAQRLSKGFEENAFGYLLVLRLAPVFPFFVINIAPALFNVPVRTYVAATFLGILPGTFAYAYLGSGVESVLVAAAKGGRKASIGDLVTPEITAAFVALAVVAAIPLIIKKVVVARKS